MSAVMDSLTTHPADATQAKSFVAPNSLSYPGDVKDGTSDKMDALASSLNITGHNPPNIVNVVATWNLDVKLDLKSIALHARNSEYNPRRFVAVIMRIREPKATALLFASGKVIVTGAKNEDNSKLAARKFTRIVQKLGYTTSFKEFKIQNMVASTDVQFPIRLEGLQLAHNRFASYEPELFPGLVYRMMKPKVVLMIFVSGKVVITGAKARENVYEAFNLMYPVLKEFRVIENGRKDQVIL